MSLPVGNSHSKSLPLEPSPIAIVHDMTKGTEDFLFAQGPKKLDSKHAESAFSFLRSSMVLGRSAKKAKSLSLVKIPFLEVLDFKLASLDQGNSR